MTRRLILLLAGLASVLALLLAGTAQAALAGGSHAPGSTYVSHGVTFRVNASGVAYSAPVYFAYHWDQTFTVAAAGLDHPVQLVRGLGTPYVIQADSAHNWKVHELNDQGRCLRASMAFVSTVNCHEGDGTQYFVPESLADGYHFRVPGSIFVWSFRVPQAPGRIIYLQKLGARGTGQLWDLIFQNHTAAVVRQPRISPANGACGTFQENAGQFLLVKDNGLSRVLTISSEFGTFCMASTGTGLYKLHVESNMSHCVTRTNSVLIINGCVQGQSAQQFEFNGGGQDVRGDWAGPGGCCLVYTKFPTPGSELFYGSLPSGSYANWAFNRTNAAHTTAWTAPPRHLKV